MEDKLSRFKNMVFGGQIGKMEDFEDKILNWRTLVPYGRCHYSTLQSTLKQMTILSGLQNGLYIKTPCNAQKVLDLGAPQIM